MKTRNTICGLVCGAALLAITATASANLIVNGSFEDPDLKGDWGSFSTITGWKANGNMPIEIGAGSIYGVTGYDGQQVMELDSDGNAVVEQILAIPGGNYSLSFLYAQRQGVAPTSGSFEVWWNGGFVQSFAPSSTAMSLYSTTVLALANNTLEFRGTGTSDSYGALIDDVKLCGQQVPDGGMSAMLLGMGLLAVGMGRKLVK